MGTSKTGISATTRNSFTIGDSNNTSKYIYVDINGAVFPGLRYNTSQTQWEYSNDGVNWNAIGSGGLVASSDWVELVKDVDYNPTPTTSSTLEMFIDQTENIDPGDPIRWLADFGFYTDDHVGEAIIYSDGCTSTITGITTDVLDKHGNLYLMQIDMGGGDFMTEVYSDPACLLLIGSTANYNSNGDKNIIEENTSGLGGTISVYTYNMETPTPVIVSYFRYGQCTSITSSLLTIYGPEFNSLNIPYEETPTDGEVLGLWHGNPERVVPLLLNLPGAYAEQQDSTALWTIGKIQCFWENRVAHLVRFGATAYTVIDGYQPIINVRVNGNYVADIGVTLTTGGDMVWGDGSDLYPEYLITNFEDDIEIAVETPEISSGNEDLTLWGIWVIE